MPASVSPATVEHPPGNGVLLPRWAWGLIAAALSSLVLGAAGWLTYVSTSQANTREDVAEMRAEVRAINQRLERIEKRLDKFLERLAGE